MGIRDVDDGWVIQDFAGMASSAEGIPGLDDDFQVVHIGDDFLLLIVDVDLVLDEGGTDVHLGNERVDLLDVVVGEPQGMDEASLHEFLHRQVGLHVVSIGMVEEHHVDVADVQPVEASLDGFLGVCHLASGIDLGDDEKLLPFDDAIVDGLPYGLSDLLLGMTSSGCFKRIGRSTYPMGEEEEEEEIRLMGLESDNILYEAQVSPRKDLTFVRFMDRIYSEKIEWTEDKLNTYGFKNDEGKYTNLALLFSDQNPIVVKLTVYKGLDRMEFKVKKEFSGSLALIIDLLTDYCQVCNDKRIVKPESGSFKRTEILSYPQKALRESVLNAIEHANYFFLSNIKVEFFDDRVEISNPGDFYGGLTLNQALHGKQSFRNPKLVYTLDKLHFVENYATGVETIFKLYEDFDKKPVFDISNTHTTVTLPNRNYEYFLEAENEESLLSNEEGGVRTLDSQDAKTDANPKNEEGMSEHPDSLKQLLVDLIKSDGSLTQFEMAKRLNVSTRTIRRLINETKEIVRVGSKQKGYWRVISENGDQKQ